ncbi:glutamate ABC transporter permease [Methylobacterium sp. Leaf399]|uniref:amino acid ABC transporter permease n=1 Tax=unclassified Methylobacterium TaxID=2615210 RepID=UPI0006F3761A|nr:MULTISPECIES: amino acid ABC transporter permease [unclassified Methylobacterium]KQP51740.1 glutamate ABC transporter permease [Methylobacterium sp. Leaf108]KQT14842.1 glutamate ABC transporter permease [Methylobacterium sp. Leaf399]KQT90508.1 glutamate ABC transporter permease [Methylobacterium sp. Leaf466]
MNYNWNWSIFFDQSPEGTGTYADMLLSGLLWTLATALCSWIIAFCLGSIIGVMRTLPSKAANAIGTGYVELFRNIPLLVQMFLWYSVMPEVVPENWGNWLKQLPNASFYTAVICLGFFTASRVAEQVRTGIESLPRGQRMAGTALGLTTAQTYRYVILPIAYRVILPPLTSEFLNNMKNTSVALTIGLLELTARARSMQEFSSQVFEAFTAATVIYLGISLLVVTVAGKIETRVAVPGAR